MSRYNYNNYYDPVGSQANQPQGYTYSGNTSQQQQPSNAAQYASNAASNYQTGYNQSYADTYGGQQYGSTSQSQQSTAASTSRAANTLSSLSNAQGYAQSALANQQSSSDTAGGYDNTYYNPSNAFAQSTNRTQSNESPLYNTAGSTFGRLSLPDQSQSSSNTYANTQSNTQSTTSNTYANNQYQSTSTPTTKYQNAPSSAGLKNRSYRTAYTQDQSQTQPPQRYASPLHAFAAQGHAKQSSQSSNHQPSPQMNVQQLQNQHQRQQSASVEPSATTVDPSQVYDFRAEQQRKAEIEAVKRRQREAEAAQRKAEEDAETARKEEEERVEREQREAEETARKAAEAEAKKKAAQERKNEQRRKAREEKRQSKTAATALTQMASGSGGDGGMMAMMGIDESVAPANAEEAEMRAMFKKMREFNAKNPQMLAKLWEEERTAHANQAASPQPAKPATAAPPKQQNANATQPRPFTKQPSQPAQASPAAATPTHPASAALWPPHKKGSLAEAAAKWLNSLIENRNAAKTIGKETVLKILDTNPSYVQLCESIEKTGIKFERSALAKELLKAVPDGLRNNNANKPVTPSAPVTGVAVNGSSGSPANTSQKREPGRPRKDGPLNYGVPHAQRNAGPVNYQTPSFTSLSDAARAVNSMDATPSYPPHLSNTLTSAISSAAAQPAVQSPYFDQPISAGSPVQPPTPEVKAEEKPEEPRRPPANKEEAARKRTFTDLVDLSKEDSDDDDGPPRKIQQPLGGPANGALKHAPSNDAFRKPMSFEEFRRTGTAGITPGQGVLHPSAPPRPWKNFGQRPQMTGQTLATPTPVPSQPKPKGPTEEQKQYERMRGKMLVEPIMRDRVARKSRYDSRTIARDVLLATGRHPDMRALNAHLNTMQKLLGDHGGVIDGAGNKSDLATVKWDIIDPGEPAEDAKAKAKSAAAGREKKSTSADADKDDDGGVTDVDDEGDWATGRAEEALRKIRKEGMDMEQALLEVKDPMVRKQIRNRIHVQRHKEKYGSKRPTKRVSEAAATDTAGEQSDSQQYVSVQEQLRGSESGPSRGRGRPPKNRERDSNLPASNNATPVRSMPQPRPSAASPSSAKMSTGTPVGYAAFRELDANGNPIKKKGRPVGWRKNIHSREAQGLDPKKSLSAGKPSRQRQSTGPTAKDDLVQPVFQVYKCKWTGCTAELDNLDRLKKHVVKLHGGANDEGDFECLWRSCKFAGKHVDANGKAHDGDDGVTSFETMDHWMKHVDKEHLSEVAWKLGDGPRGGSVADLVTDSDRYLSDRHGRSVTPIIVPAAEKQASSEDPAEPAQPILTSDLPARPRIGRPPKNPQYAGISKEEREATEELKKLEDQKRAEGVSMGQEGCKLVNAKRRRGFLDDEDFEDFVYDSEPDFS